MVYSPKTSGPSSRPMNKTSTNDKKGCSALALMIEIVFFTNRFIALIFLTSINPRNQGLLT